MATTNSTSGEDLQSSPPSPQKEPYKLFNKAPDISWDFIDKWTLSWVNKDGDVFLIFDGSERDIVVDRWNKFVTICEMPWILDPNYSPKDYPYWCKKE